jgi:hypothetical protein
MWIRQWRGYNREGMAAFIPGYSGDHAEVADRPDTPTMTLHQAMLPCSHKLAHLLRRNLTGKISNY